MQGFTDLLNGKELDSSKPMVEYIKEIGKEIDALAQKMGITAGEVADIAGDITRELTEDDKLRIYADTVLTFSDFTASLYDRRISKIEEERDAMSASFDDQIAMTDDLLISEENKSAEKERLENEKEIREDRYNKKIAKERKKQAVIDKVAAVFSIGIDTYVAAMKVEAQQGIFGIPIAAFLIAQGALAAAAVAAAPVPQYKTGKSKDDNYEGYAFLNDGGKTEYREDPKGNIHEIKGRNVVGYVGRDDIVHKDMDSMLDYHNIDKMIYNQALLTGSDISSQQVKEYQEAKRREQNSSNEQFKKDVKDIMKGWKFNHTTDNRGLAIAIADAIDQKDYQNKMM